MPFGNTSIDDEFCLLLAFEINAVSGLELDIESRAIRQSSRLDSLTTWFEAGIPTITPSAKNQQSYKTAQHTVVDTLFHTTAASRDDSPSPARPQGQLALQIP